MEKKIFEGIYGIVLTPFKENGAVDYNTLEKQIEKTLQSKAITGIAVCGSTGEFSRMSFEENTALMKTAKAAADGVQFICGATAGDSYTARRYAEFISELGADGILLAPPYYFKLSDEEILAYYRSVLENTKMPVLGYNIPQCTNPVSVSNFEKLLEFDNFKGFKNSWNDMQEITSEIALRDEKRPDATIFTGLDACLYGTLSLGGNGIFSAITYLMPDIIDVIYSNFGKNEKSFKCQCDLIKLINVVNRFTFPYGYRILSKAVGMPLGEGREAIPESTAKAAEQAEKEMYETYSALRNKYLN